MNPTDPASLQNLHDIVTAPVTPWWPTAQGWHAVFVLVLMILLRQVWIGIRQWRANAYRRDAMAELDDMRKDTATTASSLQGCAGLPSLIKRTALAAYPRKRVASLSGGSWLNFLDHTSGRPFLPQERVTLWNRISYPTPSAASMTSEEADLLYRAVRHWILHHKPFNEEGAT